MTAPRAATTASHASATVAPSPIAGPWTAATIGCGHSIRAPSSFRAPSISSSRSEASACALVISSKSPPAENAFPVEASTAALTPPSAATAGDRALELVVQQEVEAVQQLRDGSG